MLQHDWRLCAFARDIVLAKAQAANGYTLQSNVNLIIPISLHRNFPGDGDYTFGLALFQEELTSVPDTVFVVVVEDPQLVFSGFEDAGEEFPVAKYMRSEHLVSLQKQEYRAFCEVQVWKAQAYQAILPFTFGPE